MIQVLRAKIHGAKVTHANLEYEGSLGVDKALLDASGIVANEMVWVFNITNGNRFVTYIIQEPENSRRIVVNGAAARLCSVGDKLIIVASAFVEEEKAKGLKPTIVMVDEANGVKEIK